MSTCRAPRFASILAGALAALALAPRPAFAAAYDGHPKLVVILVIDQFREDYLERYRADFKEHGFRLLLDHGAYFPDCYYDYANTETAPGHSTIGTGAYSDGHGIGGNQWWDISRDKAHKVSSVQDERYAVVGLASGAAAGAGSSPRNLLASTVGDELRLATGGASEVWGVSLKDRAAILPAGAAANGAFWIDAKSGTWVSSSYYMTALPDWAQAFNAGTARAEAATEAGKPDTADFYHDVGSTPAANSYEMGFAEALITGEELGKHPTTDMLTLSLSATDILGHQVGPDSEAQRAMVDALDDQLDAFFTFLDKNVEGGLGNVWIALTADHGVAPTPAVSASLGMRGTYLDLKAMAAHVNEAINAKFSPGENQPYLQPEPELPYLALNEATFARAGINEQEAEDAVQAALPEAFAALAPAAPPATPPAAPAAPPAAEPAPPAAAQGGAAAGAGAAARAALTTPGASSPAAVAAATATPPPRPPTAAGSKYPPRPEIFRSYTREQLRAGQVPDTEWGRLLLHSYTPNGGWWVMVLPLPYQMAAGGPQPSGTNHFTPYSYDRHVPLGFLGAPFAPGVYPGRVAPVDLAATFASLLGVNQPSASIGRVLTSALKPPAQVSYPKEGPPPGAKPARRRPAARRHSTPAPAASGKAGA